MIDVRFMTQLACHVHPSLKMTDCNRFVQAGKNKNIPLRYIHRPNYVNNSIQYSAGKQHKLSTRSSIFKVGQNYRMSYQFGRYFTFCFHNCASYIMEKFGVL